MSRASRLARWWASKLAAIDLPAMVTEIARAAELSPEETEAVAAYATYRLEAMRELCELLGEDEEELYDGMASHWLELRLEWARYNQNMQYAVMLTGVAKPSLMARGAACAAALTWLEPALSASDLDALQRIAAAPLSVEEQRGQMVGTIMRQEVGRASHLASALDMTRQVEDVVGAMAEDGVLSDRLALLDHSVGRGREAIVEAQRLDFSLVAPHLERTLLEGLWRRGLSVTASVEGPDQCLASGLGDLLEQVAATVADAGGRLAASEREASAVHARLRVDTDRAVLTLRGSCAAGADHEGVAESLEDGFRLERPLGPPRAAAE